MTAELKSKIGDAKVSEKLIAMTVDCNGVYVYLDPYEGAKAVVTEACRNLACSGAVPLGATDNLNMANPHKPNCSGRCAKAFVDSPKLVNFSTRRSLAANCSLYNQNPSGPIDPTPTVAVVGIVEKPEHVTTQWFKDEGDTIILLGEIMDASDPIFGLGGSAYLQVVHGKKNRLAAALRFGNREDVAHHATRTDSIRPREKRARLQRRRFGRCVGRKLYQPTHRA